jgi:hypothetical protein
MFFRYYSPHIHSILNKESPCSQKLVVRHKYFFIRKNFLRSKTLESTTIFTNRQNITFFCERTIKYLFRTIYACNFVVTIILINWIALRITLMKIPKSIYYILYIYSKITFYLLLAKQVLR